MRRSWRLITLIIFALLLGGHPATAQDCSGFRCSSGQDGVDLTGRQALKKMGAEYVKQRQSDGPRYEYKTVDSCAPGGSKAGQEDCFSNRILLICPGEDGPLVDIVRRLVSATGAVLEPWAQIGLTCLPNEVPGAAKRPTTAMIVDAFHHTAWAKATVGFQPAGYKTLVNLPSYFAATWSTSGYAPGEIDTLDPTIMFGYQVRVRPKLVSFTYHFGDGDSFGPTTSPGGVYPTGDVRHTYRSAGVFTSHLTVIWGADFQIENGPWLPLPATQTVEQPAQGIDVHTAVNRLIP